jgi:spore maturation protein CgeB
MSDIGMLNANKSILLAGEGWRGSTVYSVAVGLRQLGWEVAQIDPSNYINICDSNVMRVINRCINRFAIANYNKAILRDIRNVRPRAFLAVKGSYITPETLKSIRDSGIETINYYPDYHFAYKSLNQETLPHYECIFTTKSFQLDYLKKVIGVKKVFYLPHGYSNDVHIAPSDAQTLPYLNDLLYIGTFNEEKLEWLEEIKRHFPTIKMTIYGHGWKKNADCSLIKNNIAGVPLFGKNFCTRINRSKINLAVHMGATDATRWKDLVSTRTFEIPACKGFMLHIDNEEVRDLFDPNTEIGVFADGESLCERIEFYLTQDNLRNEMVENAYRRCVPAYGYNERSRVISNYLDS